MVLFTLVEIDQMIRRLVNFLVLPVDRIVPFRVSATIVVIPVRGADYHVAKRRRHQSHNAHLEEHLHPGQQLR
ncbi:hypothetical protein [Mycobacterium uberis]|uniref:hypothetical protein n=1 Tax=Mycobacterium uberis TaxID=2162698 RepID=UPI001FB55E6C|nr:hypothetical protein [Mycobacterium uberis]